MLSEILPKGNGSVHTSPSLKQNNFLVAISFRVMHSVPFQFSLIFFAVNHISSFEIKERVKAAKMDENLLVLFTE